MKFRVTPLNLVSALALGFAVFSLFKPKPPGQHFDISGIYLLILFCLVVVTFITDLIFRFTLKELKKIWIVEMIFIFIAAILMLILQK